MGSASVRSPRAGGNRKQLGAQSAGQRLLRDKGHAPGGGTVKFATHEVEDGKSVPTNDTFRGYASFAEAADDYGRFVSTNPNFKHALMFRNDPEKFIDEMVRGNYATSPHYKKTLMGVIHDNNFTQYDR